MNFFQIILALCLLQLTTSAMDQAIFSAELFNTIAPENIDKNTVISPASIQTALALTYIGAEGKTADELRQGLHLGNSSVSKVQVAEQFGNLMNKMRSNAKATVKMVNRIYVRKDLQLAPTFNELAQRYFDSSAERVNFSENVKTAKKINNWVKKQTKNKIKDLIPADKINADTVVILLNAIYFKAKWLNPFPSAGKGDFYVSKIKTQKVDMMYQENWFAYAELLNLNAKALLLKYEDTDIQMLILLPNELDGLQNLEQKLKFIRWISLLRQVNEQQRVALSLPKFKFEFQVSLQPNLERLGMKELFSSSANFGGLISNRNNVVISDVLHKAFIEVNENGTEAAAATAVGIIEKNWRPLPSKSFKVDRPFAFALIDRDTVYFAGHVVDI